MTRFRLIAPFAAALLATAALPGLAAAAPPPAPPAAAAAPPAPPPPMSLEDGRAIVLAIQGAAAQGLAEPDPGASLAGLASPDPAAQSAADAALAAAAIRFARDEHGGRINPQAVNSDWALRAPYDAAADFAQARTAGRIAAWVATLAPRDRGYLGLAAAHDRYGAIVAQGGWPTVPPGKPLKPGAQDPRIPTLRARLTAEGYDIPAPAPPPSATAPAPAAPAADTPAASASAATGPAATTPAAATPASVTPAAPSVQAKEPAAASTDRLDPALDEALMLFQTRHTLKPDGVLTAATTAALNVPADERLAAIDLNLERARWMPNPLPADRIEVDTAATTAVLFQGGQPTLSMRAIVGSPTRRTPSLASKVIAVVFNPPWVVPSDIAAGELYPKERRSPGYFARNSFSVIGGQLVQAAGPKSALGYVKFDIPTPFGVYLHDTPSRSLFQRDARWLSHGCMRLEKPRELAAALLAPQGWTPAAVDAAIAAKATTRYGLTVQPPVFVVYRTVTADTDGVASFRPDAYHWDAQLAAALAGR